MRFLSWAVAQCTSVFLCSHSLIKNWRQTSTTWVPQRRPLVYLEEDLLWFWSFSHSWLMWPAKRWNHPILVWVIMAGWYLAGYFWGTHVVEICLQFSIKLWEQRNTEVHGATAQGRKRIKTAKFKAAILHLQSLQPQAHPDDSFLFDGIGVMLQEANPNTMEDWILSRRPSIYNSIRKAKNQAASDTHKLYHWYPHLKPSASTTKRLQNWFQNKLVFEPFSKKKRHKYCSLVQQRLTNFLLPCNLTWLIITSFVASLWRCHTFVSSSRGCSNVE